MRVLVSGSRDLDDWQLIQEAFQYVGLKPGDGVCHGAARGADYWAGIVAEAMGAVVVPYPVDTRVDGPWPAAGVLRNKRMLADFHPDVGLCFPLPQSKGTWDMADRLKSAGVPYTVWQQPVLDSALLDAAP